jgi:hypothetical protein
MVPRILFNPSPCFIASDRVVSVRDPVAEVTWTVHGVVITASPATTSTPSPVYRSTESWGWTVAITRCTRSITSANRGRALASTTPRSRARAICDRSEAERISALLGTHPVLRQSPPMHRNRSRSRAKNAPTTTTNTPTTRSATFASVLLCAQ